MASLSFVICLAFSEVSLEPSMSSTCTYSRGNLNVSGDNCSGRHECDLLTENFSVSLWRKDSMKWQMPFGLTLINLHRRDFDYEAPIKQLLEFVIYNTVAIFCLKWFFSRGHSVQCNVNYFLLCDEGEILTWNLPSTRVVEHERDLTNLFSPNTSSVHLHSCCCLTPSVSWWSTCFFVY